MNPVLVIIGIAILIFLWAFLTFLFKPLGGFLKKIFGDAIETMTEEETEGKNE